MPYGWAFIDDDDLPERIQQKILNRFYDQLGADVEPYDKNQDLILLFAFNARDGFNVAVYLSTRKRVKHQQTLAN